MSEHGRFDHCLSAVLRFESGYSDNPRDPGGATNLGITLATLSAWEGHPVTKDEVRGLTVAAVSPIYRANYWKAASCDLLPAGVDLIVFDTAVNMGVGTACRMLQAAAGVTIDGHPGPLTLAAVSAMALPALIQAFSLARGVRYRALPQFSTFGAGWINRLQAVTSLALEDAT